MQPFERAGHLAHARRPQYIKRLAQARQAVADALALCTRPYIAFSTGKDSTVVLDLVWSVASDVPAIYLDAHNCFPEGMELLDRLEAAGRPVERYAIDDYLDILAEKGGPHGKGVEQHTMVRTVYEPVAALVAERGYDGVFMGLRAEENHGRLMNAATRGLLYQDVSGHLRCNPVSWWSYADVWAYIASEGCDYNRTYDRMGDVPLRERRVSYWAGETANRFSGRWPWLRTHYPDLWARFAARFPEVREIC